MARALTMELSDAATGDVLVWAEALDACVRSHERDVELLNPGSSRGDARGGGRFDPTPGALPDIYHEAASRDSPLDHAEIARASDAATEL